MKKEPVYRRTSSDSMLSVGKSRKSKRDRMMVQILPTCFEDGASPSSLQDNPFAMEKCCKQNASPPRRRKSSEIDLSELDLSSLLDGMDTEDDSDTEDGAVGMKSVNAKSA